MATHAPITGAPTRAPETLLIDDAARDVQTMLGQVRHLARALDDGMDDVNCTTPAERESVDRVVYFSQLIAGICERASSLCEEIEVAGTRIRSAVAEDR